MSQNNPLLADWTASFGVPPLAEIKPEHFAPAFEQALTEHRREVEAVAASSRWMRSALACRLRM